MHPLYLALAVAGIALSGVRFVWWSLKGSLRYDAFLEQIRKLMVAGNRDRALKLCRAVPGSPYPDVVRAAIEAGEQKESRAGEGVATESPGKAFDRVRAAHEKRVRWMLIPTVIGPFVAVGATLFSLVNASPSGDLLAALRDASEMPPIWSLAPPVVAVILAVGGEVKARGFRDTCDDTRRGVVSMVEHYDESR